MARNFKKIAALLLALITVVGSMASCAGGDQGGTAADTGSDVTTAVTEAVTEKEAYKAAIPEGTNYEGYEFKLHVFPEPGADPTWYDADFSATEETGETLNDAAFIRMRNVNEMLNIKIVPLNATSDGSELQKAVQSNSDTYDAGFVDTFGCASISQSGYLMNLHDVPTLDLSQPWWDQHAVEDLPIAGKLYMVTGDIGTMYKKSIGVILFNKQLAANDMTMPNPYELVANKQWTIDAFIEMSKKVSEDINGDGKYNKDDKYGLLYYCDMIALGLLGAGVEYTAKDSEGLPTIIFYSDKTVKVFEKYTELLFDKTLSFSWSASGLKNDDVIAMFQDNRGLFNFNEFHAIENMRQMDTDFGILPMPLYDENQEDYRHSVNPHVAAMAVVPKSNLDMERIGYVLDALGAESKNILTPAYYETYLKGKGARDDESEASLDIIFSTLRYDIGYLYNFGNLGQFTLDMVNTYKGDIASRYTKLEPSIMKALQKAIDNYMKE